jgi:ectoine hydroxylase-related dioxygenase (phytanoyl-CoA dioxygenase family)
MMIDNAYHIKTAGTEAHTGWHRDAKVWAFDETNWSEDDRSRWEKTRLCEVPHYKIKVFVFVNDVDETTGPFSVVPGTHRVDDPAPKLEDLESMPNHAKLTGSAGSAAIWNGRIWHTALNNRDTKARRMLLYNYTHFGDKQYEECVPRGDFRKRMIAERSPKCLQLLGIKRA